MTCEERNRLKAAIHDLTTQADAINLTEYMTAEKFLGFKLYLASRDFRNIPEGLTVREYLESQSTAIFGYELASIADRVSSWLSARAHLSVEEYSASSRTWHDGQINIIGPEDVPTLSVIDQISFRLVGVRNYRHPIEVGRFLDRIENFILRQRYNLYDDMTDEGLSESKKLMSCAGFSDTWTLNEVAAQMARIRKIPLGTFINSYDCIWSYMKKPYRMRIFADYNRRIQTQPVAHRNSTWTCIKKSICWLLGRNA
jgi:hypothetical protein